MGVGAAVVGSAVVGAAASSSAASKQANAAGKAADVSAEASAQMRQDLAPYSSLGQSSIDPYLLASGYYWDNGEIRADPNSILNQRFSFNPSDLESTPGYQFTLQQGLKSTNNALAAQGLGLSGAQAKGVSEYTTGLANQTYGDQYNRALSTFNTNQQQQRNNANSLAYTLGLGQQSAAQTGQQGISSAATQGNFLTQQGNAQAAGIAGIGNAANNASSNYMLYNALYK